MRDTETVVTQVNEVGIRLDRLLSQRFPGESRAYFQRLVEQGLVLVNGSVVKKSAKLAPRDEIEVQFALTPELSLDPEPIPLDIVYEDEWMLAVNKPANLVVHPGIGNWSGTFVNALLHHCAQLPHHELRPGIVHRLDKETSGLLLAAKTEKAQQRLVQAFADREIHKEYLAVCIGKPDQLVIDVPIGRHPKDRKRQAVIESGKPAHTSLEVLAHNGQLSLIKAMPKTGRTHQIRVHLKHAGAPVLGDAVYGKRGEENRQLLHAYRLELAHPITGEALKLIAPVPSDIASHLRRFGCECLCSESAVPASP